MRGVGRDSTLLLLLYHFMHELNRVIDEVDFLFRRLGTGGAQEIACSLRGKGVRDTKVRTQIHVNSLHDC